MISFSTPRLVQLGPPALLLAVWLLAAYRAGGYLPDKWLPLAIATGFAGLVVAVVRAYSRPPRKLLLLVLALFTLYVLWMALSTTWALAAGPAWLEAARAGFYLVFFALALTYLGHRGAETAGRSLLLVAGLVIVAIGLSRFASASALATDFLGDSRLTFPLTYPNSSGNFYFLLVWPLLWLAADPRGRLWIRALSLGTIPVLFELGLLTQSRGAAAALVISGVAYFVLTPARLRSLVFLAVPVLLAGLAFVPLTAYYSEGAGEVGHTVALAWLAGSFGAAAVAGLVLSLVDRRVSLPSRLRLALSVVVIVALLAGAGVGILQLRDRVGDLSEWASGVIHSFVTDKGDTASEGLGESRFGAMGGSGRGIIWRTAWEGFLDSPAVGNGAGSYRYINELRRTEVVQDPHHTHSIELDLLAETGVVGLVLFAAALGTALGVILAPRLRSWWTLARRRRPFLLNTADPGTDDAAGVVGQAWTVALTAAVLFWFIHASIDWLWQFPGVTLGALLLLAYALSASAPSPADGDTEAPRRTGKLPARLFRIGLLVVSVAVVVGTGLPYLSLQYQKVALARMDTDQTAALSDTSRSHTLFPVSPEPFLLRADVYRSVATDATAVEDQAERAQGVLDALALALVASERAIAEEEASSEIHRRAGLAALDLLAARDQGATYGPDATRWAGLGAAAVEAEQPGGERVALSMATADELLAAGRILALTDQELLARATGHLQAAFERNSLNTDLSELLDLVRTKPSAGD
ncbi:MAG: O-antigen ligase family protein [Thermoleophilia bacterium]|nr:O-antigen ligase family protein [Thermoleophilia bacterium]